MAPVSLRQPFGPGVPWPLSPSQDDLFDPFANGTTLHVPLGLGGATSFFPWVLNDG